MSASVSNPQLTQRVLVSIGQGCRFFDEITFSTGLDSKQINNALVKLRKRGLVERRTAGGHDITDAGRSWLESGLVITSGQGRKSIRKSVGLRERAWWLMREVKQFTLADLLTTLATGTERDAESNLRKYINALEAVGVVKRLKRRAGTLAIWRLMRDLGRQCPVRRYTGEIYDPNSSTVLSVVEEAGHD